MKFKYNQKVKVINHPFYEEDYEGYVQSWRDVGPMIYNEYEYRIQFTDEILSNKTHFINEKYLKSLETK